MKIQLKREPRGTCEELNVDAGVSVEEIYQGIKDELPYTILAAKVNNRFESLSFRIQKDSSVELLDGRVQAARLIYQNSLILLYLKAVENVLGPVRVNIENAINQGLYTEVKAKSPVTAKNVRDIQAEMLRMVEADLPYESYLYTASQAIELLKERGQEDKIALLCESGEKAVPFYSLDGYKDFFYTPMLPSTGYIGHFQLMKYRRGVLLRFPTLEKPDTIPDFVEEKVLYQTFGEQARWGKLMDVTSVADLNRKIENGEINDLIRLSEALHEKKIVEIVKQIVKQKKRMILIAGPSGSGKTTFAQRLCIQLRVAGLKPLYMGTDDYFVERKDTPLDAYGEPNYEDLDAMDVELFNRNMNDLLAGKEVDLPSFNFITGCKEYGQRITSIRSTQPIVIEGIHALNDDLTPAIPQEEKFKIYISPLTQLNIDEHNRVVTTDHRMLRRMVRDLSHRGYSAQRTLSTWSKVRAGENKNIFPYSNEADAMFNSVHLYEIGVLKKYAQPLLAAVKPEEPEYGDAQRMLEFLRYFRTIEDDSAIPNNSLLREFVGGSTFED